MPEDDDLPSIIKNRPLPDMSQAANARGRYGLARLEPGDSIEVEVDQSEKLRSAANNYRMFNKHRGWRYATRRVDTPAGVKFVLWRVS